MTEEREKRGLRNAALRREGGRGLRASWARACFSDKDTLSQRVEDGPERKQAVTELRVSRERDGNSFLHSLACTVFAGVPMVCTLVPRQMFAGIMQHEKAL